jgi:hypothetical protein
VWYKGCASVFQTDDKGSNPLTLSYVPMAQWITQLSSKQKIEGSNPSRNALQKGVVNEENDGGIPNRGSV